MKDFKNKMDAHHTPHWIYKEPNFARLQMAVCRREVILGRDTIIKLEKEEQSNEENIKENGQNK